MKTGNFQLDASETVLRMANSLSDFSGEANKEDVAGAASNIIGSLGSVAKVSNPNLLKTLSNSLNLWYFSLL